MTTKTLTPLLEGIEAGTTFTFQGVMSQIKIALQKVLTGGLDRAEFERKLFTCNDISALPVGHLLDHRFRMCEKGAAALLAGEISPIRSLLHRMLCTVPHSQAASLVGRSIGCEPIRDAFELMEVYTRHPKLARHCLSGHLGDAVAVLPTETGKERSTLISLIAKFALYYGAFELQLIAARQKAIENFRFAVVDGRSTNAMGEVMLEMRQLIAAVRRAKKILDTAKHPRGPKPDLFSLMEARKEEILSNPFVTGSGLSVAEMIRQLQELHELLAPIVDEMEAALNRASDKSKKRKNRAASVRRGVGAEVDCCEWPAGLFRFARRLGPVRDRLESGGGLAGPSLPRG